MTDKLEPTQADPLSVACRKCFQGIGKVCCGVRRAHRVRYLDAQAMKRDDADEYTEWRERIENLRATHSGEGRSYGAGEVEGWRRREIQDLGAAISMRNWHQVETAHAALRDKMDAVLIEAHRAALATHQGEGEIKKMRAALFFLASAEAEYRRLHDLHGDSDIRTGRAWDRMRRRGDEARAALAQPEAGGERA